MKSLVCKPDLRHSFNLKVVDEWSDCNSVYRAIASDHLGLSLESKASPSIIDVLSVGVDQDLGKWGADGGCSEGPLAS